jgi:hypothetical protein
LDETYYMNLKVCTDFSGFFKKTRRKMISRGLV